MTICAKCQRPNADGNGSVQYREVVGLQEWTVWTYHAACAPPNEAGSGTLGSKGFEADPRERGPAQGQPPRPDETEG